MTLPETTPNGQSEIENPAPGPEAAQPASSPQNGATAEAPADQPEPCNLQPSTSERPSQRGRNGKVARLALCNGAKPLAAHPQLLTRNFQLFLGLDVARFRDLCVIDVGLKIDSIMYDLLRLELHDHTFTRMEALLYPLLRLPQLKRACIDSTGMGTQLAEQAREHFGWKVESVNFTAALKEELAFALRREFEDCRLRIPADEKLRADLRAVKKEITPSGKLRFIGEVEESHCDRTWAKALRQHAARQKTRAGAIVV